MYVPSLKSMAHLMTGHTKTRDLDHKRCRTAEILLASGERQQGSTQEHQNFRACGQETKPRGEAEAWTKWLKASNNRRNQVR